MGSTQEMATLLAKRDARIRELEIENMELKSKLDKYQMIFTAEGSTAVVAPVTPVRSDHSSRVRRTNRGLGISAEPQSLKTLQELTTKTFPEIKKDER